MFSRLLHLGLCLLVPAVLAAQEIETIVFVDPVDYSGWSSGSAPMNAVWTLNSGTAPVTASGSPFPASTKYFKLNNGVARASLERTLTHDFDLSFDALHTSYSRLLWVGLFNASGTQGYVASWDSSAAGSWDSQGMVRIRKFNVANPTTDLLYNTTGTLLGSNVASGHNSADHSTAAISPPFARIRLTWSRDGGVGTLRLYVDDNLRQTVTDNDFATFSRVCASGSTGSMFDNIVVAETAGATVPFLTHEAEAAGNTTTGNIVALSTLPSPTTLSPELEASGRAYVNLDATGEYLQIPVTATADRLVLRHCIPDTPSGGGATATLNLYVNGAFRQSLTLSSKHNWLYGSATGNGQDNNPALGSPHVFWDESRHTITGGVNAGDTLRLQKDSANTAAYYRIDLLDLELAPAPLPPPSADYVSVIDHGANGADSNDDTAAIQAAIDDAKDHNKIVWIPAGTYYQNGRFGLDGVKVRGAGMWHTSIIGNGLSTDWSGSMGFDLQGNGAGVSDLYIASSEHTSRGVNATAGGKPITGKGSGWIVENLWITHTIVGVWITDGDNGIVRGCRIRSTYADGINLNAGASNNLVENNHLRGCGDDGIAILSENPSTIPPKPVSQNNTIRLNTVVANWWGHNGDLAAGSGHLVENNFFADSARMGAFTLNLPNAYAMYPLTGAKVRRNYIVRGGGNISGQQRGAFWIFADSNTISSTTVAENRIEDSVFRGIHLTGTKNQQITFDQNVVLDTGNHGIYVQPGVVGSGNFTNNFVDGVPAGYLRFKNDSTSYSDTRSGNNF